MATATTQSPVAPALAERTSYLIHKAGIVVLEAAERALAPFGLRARHYNVLSMLGASTSPSQQELARQLGIDPTLLVAAIDELERAGLVERLRSPSDRRRYTVQLTLDGRRTLRRADEAIQRVEEVFLGPISGQERDALRAIMQQVMAPHWPTCASA